MRIEIPWYRKEESKPWMYEVPLSAFSGYEGEIDIVDDKTGKLDVAIVDSKGFAKMNVGSVTISKVGNMGA